MEEIIQPGRARRRAGLLRAACDKDALATIGIDLDAVRARIEASFGAGGAGPRRPGWAPGHGQGAGAAAAAGAAVGARGRGAAGHRLRAQRGAPGLPRRPAVLRAGSAAQRAHPVHPGRQEEPRADPARGGRQADSQIGVEHIALALTTIKQGLVPQILSAAGAPAAALRAAILDRYRQAS